MFERFKNHKYAQIAFYVALILCGVITFYLVGSNLGNVKDFFDKIFNVLSPLIYGFIIAYLLHPFMKLCEEKFLRFQPDSFWEKKVKRPLSVFITMIFFFVIVSVFVGLIVPQVGRSFMDLEAKITDYVAAAQTLVDQLIRDFPLFNGQYENLSEFLDINEISTDLKSLISVFYLYLEMGANYIISYAGKFVIEVKNALIGVIVAIYFLLSKEKLVAKCKKFLAAIFNRRHYLNLINLLRFTDKTVGGFIIGKLIDSVIIGILTFIVMSIIKMPFTPLISVIVGITNIIPFFGPFIGAIPSSFIIFIADPSKTLWFILMILIIQQLDGNIIGPKILGQSTGLSSLAVLISITVASGFFGVPGMILGVPAAAVICTLVRQKTDKKLREKNAATNLEYYFNDPPLRDFDSEPIFILKDELPDETQKKE
jgi:predicted PurR-regulated permease PerM